MTDAEARVHVDHETRLRHAEALLSALAEHVGALTERLTRLEREHHE